MYINIEGICCFQCKIISSSEPRNGILLPLNLSFYINKYIKTVTMYDTNIKFIHHVYLSMKNVYYAFVWITTIREVVILQ